MTMFPIEKRLSSIGGWSLIDENPRHTRPNQRLTMIHAMDLIFTMIGCIVLNIDHRPNVQRFEKVLSPDCINTIRGDLENLLLFEKKLVNSFLVAWIKIKYSNKVIFTTSSTSSDGMSRKFLRKSDLRLAILRVIKSMIFRTRAKNRTIFQRNDNHSWTSDRPIRSRKRCDRSIIDYLLPIEYPRKVRIIALAEPQRQSWASQSIIALTNRPRSLRTRGESRRLPVASLTPWKYRSPGNSSRFWPGQDITNNHVCKKFHCPLCYGWLWLPVVYAIHIFSTIFMSFIQCLIESILGQ